MVNEIVLLGGEDRADVFFSRRPSFFLAPYERVFLFSDRGMIVLFPIVFLGVRSLWYYSHFVFLPFSLLRSLAHVSCRSTARVRVLIPGLSRASSFPSIRNAAPARS